MLAVLTTLSKNVRLKPKFIIIDNFVFKVHYCITFWLLLVCTILVCSREYIGEHIRCLYDPGNDEDGQKRHFVETYCFFTATFTVIKHLNVTSVVKGDVAHPGVGPSIADGEEDIIRHAYYQWVPFLLFFQALCFYMPHLFWKHWEGNRLKALIVGFNQVDIVDQVKKRSSLEEVQNAFTCRLQTYRSWTWALVLSEKLNLLNIILQIVLTDKFLGGQFLSLGVDMLSCDPDEISPFDVVFPKVTKCTFRKFGPSGDVQYHDVLCVMALNIINEKIYLTLWFWFLFVFLLSVLALLWRLLSYILHSRSQNFNILTFGLSCHVKVSAVDLICVMDHYSYSDWLFLLYLSCNMEGRLVKELLHSLSQQTSDTSPQRSRRHEESEQKAPLL